ncbi:WD40/YVTN/BNR-like repeat-containing protein [Methylomagnum ishizawai]|uniref:WD40/YVTN/BNR-like repeat-containing protein n=1 Tax=Methylomagnum ishizawai TaxID=1760988 RepID=UPI001C7E3582|nr:sialidase family protein [Methylomagnum ishizawai]
MVVAAIKKKPVRVLMAALIASGLCGPDALAEWTPRRTLAGKEQFLQLFPVSDQTVWALTWQGGGISPSYRVHVSLDAGSTWTRRQVRGLPPDFMAYDDRIDAFVALDGATALLSGTVVDGVGAGVAHVYRTGDAGRTWREVFAHPCGVCRFQIGMADGRRGLMAFNFGGTDAKHPAGQRLYATHDGGLTWTQAGIADPVRQGSVGALFVKGRQAWLQGDGQLYYSADLGVHWSAEPIPAEAVEDNGFGRLRMANRDYGIASSGNLLDLSLKRPDPGAWRHLDTGVPNGAVGTLALDGKECWFSMPLDSVRNFYSDDHCASFQPLVVDPQSAFFTLGKAWRGRSLWGTTRRVLYMDRRSP